ncbi:MAG: putative tricarboxylic transport rane protein [Thermosediminibacterales bacterium]|nr:putative tricarboxylic transport rane protein [Thermosediminibacterales bacterium]MDK2836278.1 putative tricarboxylic transport rane protein [Thermosediminibacterales bacterium]
MTKKIVALAVVCLLVFTLLSGCGSSDTAQPKEEPTKEETKEPAAGNDYPNKPIEVIVAYSAGGPTDVPARVIAKYWEKQLGQPLVVVNKPGAQGQIGFTELAKSKPDGYTIGFINVPSVNLTSIRSDGLFSVDDYDYIGVNIIDPGAIIVSKDSKYKTLKDLLDAAKAKPGEVLMTCNGPATDDYLGLLDIQDEMGVEFGYMPQTGDAETITAVMGGHADVGLANFSNYVAHKDDLRVLAVMDARRPSQFPDIPTFEDETGKKLTYASLRGVAAPKGLPPEILEKLRETFEATANDPEEVAALEKIGFDKNYWSAEEFEKYTKNLTASIEKRKDKLGLTKK